ncbi:hypothetical protein ACWDBC_11470 [Streptomyces parvus]|uniref:hypothetical protein n=1 Tax=Streptomyces sp. NPDC007002 TaxID=3156910 RepID=UPI00345284B3
MIVSAREPASNAAMAKRVRELLVVESGDVFGKLELHGVGKVSLRNENDAFRNAEHHGMAKR